MQVVKMGLTTFTNFTNLMSYELMNSGNFRKPLKLMQVGKMG